MDSREHLVFSYETLSTTAPEAQWNLQMSGPTLKQETVDCIDDEETACSDNMYPSEPLEPSKFVNDNDNKDYSLEQLKKEFPEDDCPQSHYPSEPLEPSKYVNYYDSKEYALEQLKMEFPEDECPQSHDMELLKLDEQTIKHENSEVPPLSSIIKEENVNINYQVTIKTEELEEQNILYNAEATSIHYDVLITPRVVQCKLCGRIFKNSFNLFKHNNEHIKVEINTPGDNEMIELHQYRYCDKVFNNSHNMLAHFGGVHNKKVLKDDFCGKKIPSILQPCGIINDTNNDKLTGEEDMKIKYKCDSCEREYKSRSNLIKHIKMIHHDYGRTFECWCGKQFRTPIHLTEHKRFVHRSENVVYKCKLCEAVFNVKKSLTEHIKRMHYDYSRTFDCWCGKQFRTPKYLRNHMMRPHDGKMKNCNNNKVQCDYCQNFYKSKNYLREHIKMVHYDYGKLFACWCGKQFRTPIRLSEHKRMQHRDKKEVNKCKFCDAVFNVKSILTQHIKRRHHDYGRTFECWCGKQFRTPIHLTEHKRFVHGSKNELNKCKFCDAVFNVKSSLTQHIKRRHHDYGRTFDCWCGKQFRTPMYLTQHKRKQHTVKHEVYKCKFCDAVFNVKSSITRHVQRTHHDYGRTFECSCGKQFRTPIHLTEHITVQHDSKNEVYKCKFCDAVFNVKRCLTLHIKRKHYDYGRTFACWCGKQFRTPTHLRRHMKRQHDGKMKDGDNDKSQFDSRSSTI